MAGRYWKGLFVIFMVISMAVCASKETVKRSEAQTSGGLNVSSGSSNANVSRSSLPASKTAQSPESFILNPDRPDMGTYMRVNVNDFIVILDASGSKYIPYAGKPKLRIAKDIVRRLNQNTPERPLFGGLRRYGYEAGAWSTPTVLLYGMTDYMRDDFARAIEIVRWAGGKSPLAQAIDKSSDDFQQAKGHYLALVIVSDGKIYKGDPVDAAKRIKQRYGDRLCIYTALVGNLPFGEDILRRIAEVGECGYMITSDRLERPDIMRDWADDIFHRGRKAEPPPPPAPLPPAVARTAPPPARNPCAELDEALKMKVLFDLNKWDIRPEYYNGLDRIASLMLECLEAQVNIDGHTCNIWTEKYNMKLSHLRATEVMSYLVRRGVPSNRLSVNGYGLTTPSASNKTEEGRVANRRAEFRRTR